MSDFPGIDAETWRAMAAKTLGDRPFESLRSATAEGLVIEPLYAPGAGSQPVRPSDADRPWDIRGRTTHPDPAGANAEILADLQGGAASALIAIDPSGETGVPVGGADGLARVLDGVVLEFAGAALDAGFLGAKAADWLGAAAKASPAAKLAFHMDPISAFAVAGASPGPIESHLVACATVAPRLAAAYPQASLFLASGRAYHEAGGGESGEIAFAAASALAYAKALVRAGVNPADAFRGVALGLSADADVYLTIAKLRAARRVWRRLTSACGAETPAVIEVRSSHRMLAAQDPWTNMLRLAAAGFGAAVGGADAVMLGAFTDALGRPTAFARRQSRNTQLVLMEEAHLGRVLDPAAGSGFLEALTDQMARAAWTAFQAIEAKGGVLAALKSGHVAVEAAEARAARGEPRIVGVTAFPPSPSEPPPLAEVAVRPVEAPSPRLPGPDSACPPLTPIRLAQAHEAAA